MSVSVVRVISTSTPRALRAAASFLATESVTSFSTNHAGLPMGPVMRLSAPPCPASTTTSLRVEGLLALDARGGDAGVLTDSTATVVGVRATDVDDAATLVGGLVSFFGARVLNSDCATS